MLLIIQALLSGKSEPLKIKKTIQVVLQQKGINQNESITKYHEHEINNLPFTFNPSLFVELLV